MFLANFLTPWALLAVPVILYLLPYLRRWSLRDIPGPPGAALSNLWLLYQSRRGRRFLAVDEAHKKYGTMVRIQPDHVSIASPEAIPIVYGHGNGFMKACVFRAETITALSSVTEDDMLMRTIQRVLRRLC